MTKNRLGLIVGAWLAILHAVWSLAVAVVPVGLQNFVLWVLDLHHISMPFEIMAFNLANAVKLVILTFVVGYIVGWLFDWLVRKIKR